MHDTPNVDVPMDATSDAPSVAIIGMSGRFPGAADCGQFWDNLVAARDCIGRFTAEELLAGGIDPMAIADPRYVRAKGVVENPLHFDASLFGYSPHEAELIDPQQRIFLECAMTALEDAGCNPDGFEGCIGIYGGQSMSTYLLALMANPSLRSSFHLLVMANDKDYLASRVAYKLNLKGPCVVVASACSTSLVAVSMAFQALIDYQCDVALAGGVCVNFPTKEGHIAEEGGNNSSDGYIRAFDAQANGLVGGNGAGVIVLKRLEDALADRDHIYAVIRSCAVNNDGSQKIGYHAPSVDGQAEGIALAHALGGIDPATISYIEAHGTGTRLGDPIEVAALIKAFRLKTSRRGFCGIGTVKTNIGHLDAAAGIAGLIKTSLALQNRFIPASLNFSAPNPQIDFVDSPFFVCDTGRPWSTDSLPRRAGVSSFAIGGTNAHVLVEEAPLRPATVPPRRDLAVLTLSANTMGALKRAATNLAQCLRRDPAIDLADAAFSLQVGRKAWKYRLAVVCRDAHEAADRLEGTSGHGVFRGQTDANAVRVVFLFPGQGAQYVGMTRGLYECEGGFRAALDECVDLLEPELGFDLRTILFAPDGDIAAATAMEQTRLTQPALFAVEYALAKLWMSWGVAPAGMLGHSIGEYVAACVAGVMDLPDALRLVSRRGALMQCLPPGGMASIPLPEHELTPLITAGLSLAAVLGPKLCVVAGKEFELDALIYRLGGHGIESHRIRTSHAFHSKEMEPIVTSFVDAFHDIVLHPPRIPFISNVTGTWITDAEATDPDYWGRQLRNMVRIHDGLFELTRPAGTLCLEVGPGRSLSSLSQQAAEGRRIAVVATCRNANDPVEDMTTLVGAVAKLWAAGGALDWRSFSSGEERRKVPLPTYPFDHEEYSLLSINGGANADPNEARRGNRVSDLLFSPTWRRSTLPPFGAAKTDPGSKWLVFLDRHGLGVRCAQRLKALGRKVVTVALDTGDGHSPSADHQVDARDPEAFKRLVLELEAKDFSPHRILHLWNVGPPDPTCPRPARIQAGRTLAFDSLLYLVQAMGTRATWDQGCLITIVSTGLADVTGTETIEAEKAFLIGPCRVIPVEYPRIGCKSVDLAWHDVDAMPTRTIDSLLSEAGTASSVDVAFRGADRWIRSFGSIYFNPHGDPVPDLPSRLRERGTYLITGGLGGIGLEIAHHLAQRVGARLVLTGRTAPSSPELLSAIERIEAAGGDVMTASADVTDHAAMSAVVAQAIERFGPIHGVIHSAGVAGRGIMQLKTRDDVDRVLAPKVQGVVNLHAIFAEAALDFFVVFSSVAIVVGAPGQAEYTAANAFLDAFVAEHRQGATHMVSLDWDRWSVVGMAVNEAANQPAEARDAPGLEPGEGAQAFELALNSSERQIAIALGPFEWISRYGPPRAAPPAREAPAPLRGYRRPDLDTTFEPPRNALETAVAALFHEILGIKDVGIDDNFFDMGGHSLLGVQLVNRMQQAFAVQVGVGELFNMPTVRSLGAVVLQRQTAIDARPVVRVEAFEASPI